MTFSRPLLLFILTFVILGCSGQVEDKNSELSNKEKKDLLVKKKESLEVTSLDFENSDAIREDNREDSNIVGKYYTMKVCLKDTDLVKGLGSRPVTIDNVRHYTDTDGCVRWDHELDIDLKTLDRCKVFTKKIRFSNGKKKTLRYSIDYLNDKVTDLDKSKGCLATQKHTKSSKLLSPIEAGKIDLYYGSVLTKIRTDIRWIKHQTVLNSCLKVTKSGRPLAHTRVMLTATNKETGEVSKIDKPFTTNSGGCFSTDFVSEYEQFKHSHWMPVDLEFEVQTGDLSGSVLKRQVFINPWEPSRIHYGIGVPGRMPKEIEFKNDYAKLHMDGVMYILIGNDANELKVNDYLGLTVSKSYQVVLNPYINREHRYTRNAKPIERIVHDGKFKLSMAILAPKGKELNMTKDNFEDFEYVTGAQKIVNIKNGIINEIVNIPFKMTDMPRLSLRTMTVFKIEPVGDTGLQNSIVTGFFKARIAWIKTNVFQAEELNIPGDVDKTWDYVSKRRDGKADVTLEQVDSTCSTMKKIEKSTCVKGLNEIVTNGVDQRSIAYNKYIGDILKRLGDQTAKQRELKRMMSISAKTIYANHLNKVLGDKIEIINTDQARRKGIQLTSQDMKPLFPKNGSVYTLKKAPKLAHELCKYGHTKDGEYTEGFFGKKKVRYNSCLRNPDHYFAIKPIRHVEKVNKIGKFYSTGYAIYVGERYGTSKGERSTYAESIYAAVDIGAKTPSLGPFSLGFKAGKSFSQTESESEGFDFGENIGSSKNIGVEKFVIDVNGTMERCVLIVSKDYLDVKEAARRRAGLIGGYSALGASYGYEDDYYRPMTNLDTNFYLCDKRKHNEVFSEAWYFLQSRIEANFATDYDSNIERRLLKVIRGTRSFYELRESIRDLTTKNLLMDNIAHGTPEDMLIGNWGHLVNTPVDDSTKASFLKNNFEGSFPGTIEGLGGVRAE